MDRRLAPGVEQIDTLLGGWEGVNSVFLVSAERPCLVETGPQRDAGRVIAALQRRGVGPEDLAWIVLSHIHLDHGGGVGELAAHFPRAQVVCHPRGLRHLASPERLVEAASRVYGERMDSLYGGMTPVAEERLHGAEDGQALDLGGGRSLLLIYSPGHAKHHLGVLEQETGVLMVGDAVGVQLPAGGRLRPATPPDDFELDQALHSLWRFRELGSRKLVLTHFGEVGEPAQVLDEAQEELRRWCGIAERAYMRSPTRESIAAALRDEFESEDQVLPQAEVLNGIESNAAGLHGWLLRQDQARRTRSTAPSQGPG